MNCMYCDGDTQVVNSRPRKRSNTVWRRRQCLNCHTVFTSIEEVDMKGSVIVRKPGKPLEPFSRDKLLLSVYDSLRHRKTAVADAEGLTMTIISRLRLHIHDATVTRHDIVKVSTTVLKRFDKVAYTHYRAFHTPSAES